MAANGEFIGLNEQGINKIVTAIDYYIKAVNNVVMDATTYNSIFLYAKGASSVAAIERLKRNIDEQSTKLVFEKLTVLKDRISALSNQYKNNDNAQANTLNTKAKSILKS